VSTLNRIVVGADFDDSQGNNSGAASYVYRRSKGAWNLELTLPPAIDDTTEDHGGYLCGSSVDMSNDGEMVVFGCTGSCGLY